jgi:hypothetical protein
VAALEEHTHGIGIARQVEVLDVEVTHRRPSRNAAANGRSSCWKAHAKAGSVVLTDPNIATSWTEAHGCGISGNGYGPGTMGSTTPSRNISPHS